VSELIDYAQFLERRERRRTADHGPAFPGGVGPARPGAGGPSVIDCEPVEPAPFGGRRARAAALAGAVTPPRGPVPRWRARRPVADR
jgi:hypothetical protein